MVKLKENECFKLTQSRIIREIWYFYQNLILNQSVYISIANKTDALKIASFYEQLSIASKQKFAPHPFTTDYLTNQLLENNNYLTIIAKDKKTDVIIGYSVTQLWLFDYDIERWSKYGQAINNDNKKIACFAPSVADEYHYTGVGTKLLNFTTTILKEKSFEHILLWGGVKCTNIPALKFYLKNGFKLMGHFDYEGSNYDMLLTID